MEHNRTFLLICLYFILHKSFLAKSFNTNNNNNNNKSITSTSRFLKISKLNKYIIYECKFHCGGWADRLKGIMSLYALSLLTNRHFLIDIRTPCNFSNLFMPNKIDWLPEHSLLQNNKRTYIECLNNFEPECIAKANYFLDDKHQLPVIAIKSNQEWFTNFSKNSLFHSKILNLGFNSTQLFKLHLVFHQFYKKLFRLTPHMEKKYNEIKRSARITDKTQIFCAQIRIGGARPNVKFDSKINEFGRTQKLFWTFLRKNFIRSAFTNDWRIFITSDIESIELEAMQEFGDERVIRIKGLNTHVDREANLGNDCTRIEKPILDFHFLQNCHKAVISHSGFGRLGVWNRRMPMKDVFVFDGVGSFLMLEKELSKSNDFNIFLMISTLISKNFYSFTISIFIFLLGFQFVFLLKWTGFSQTKRPFFLMSLLFISLFNMSFFYKYFH
jgi:hypothetical protein